MKKLVVLVSIWLVLMASNVFAACPGGVCYVRIDGGTSTQCTGAADAAYDGSGTGEACAFKHRYYAQGWYATESGGVYSGGVAGVMTGGDDLFIQPGTYTTGYDSQWTGCSQFNSSRCIARKPPSGTLGNPTRIFGCGASGCAGNETTWPKETAIGRMYRFFDLTGLSYVEIGWLNITDNSTCSEGSNRWNCGAPNVSIASGWDGIEWTGASNIILRSVNVHGLARDGLEERVLIAKF